MLYTINPYYADETRSPFLMSVFTLTTVFRVTIMQESALLDQLKRESRDLQELRNDRQMNPQKLLTACVHAIYK